MAQDMRTITRMVLCCPRYNALLHLQPKGAAHMMGRAEPQCHPVQGPTARARLVGAGASPTAGLRAGPGRPPQALSLGSKMPAPADPHYCFRGPANTSCKFAWLRSVSTGAQSPCWGSPSLSRHGRRVPSAREHPPCPDSVSGVGCSHVGLLPWTHLPCPLPPACSISPYLLPRFLTSP